MWRLECEDTVVSLFEIVLNKKRQGGSCPWYKAGLVPGTMWHANVCFLREVLVGDHAARFRSRNTPEYEISRECCRRQSVAWPSLCRL